MRPLREVWVNLEYLSAEDWVEGFHGLPSPRADGLTEYFFYPGFTTGSGGLLREADLIERRDAFQADEVNARHYLAGLGVHRSGAETIASLLCYPDAPLDLFAQALAGSSARLHLLVPDGATGGYADVEALAAAGCGRMRFTRMAFLAQIEYDHLLWSCDLNFVRGEDSLTRGVWSGKPFIWQIYRQADAVHVTKLEAFLRLLAPGTLADATRWWNGTSNSNPSAIVELVAHPARAMGSLDDLARQTARQDLTRQLLDFALDVSGRNRRAVEISGKL